MSDFTSTLADLDTVGAALLSFFKRFTPDDWAQPHGRDWTFADVPYHLALFNLATQNGIENQGNETEKVTLREINAWNDAQFARRPAGYTGSDALGTFRETLDALRSAAAERGGETAVFLPFLFVGGWRTMAFSITYVQYHIWLHLVEASLRRNGRLPHLPPQLTKRELDFQARMTADILPPSDLAGVDLVIGLRLTGEGGGAWTFTLRDGQSRVAPGVDPKADGEITSDIATHMKTAFLRMQNPLLALLLRQTRLKGMRAVAQYQALYAISPDRRWRSTEWGRPGQGSA